MEPKLVNALLLLAAFTITIVSGSLNQNRLMLYEAREYGNVTRTTLLLGNFGAFFTGAMAVISAVSLAF